MEKSVKRLVVKVGTSTLTHDTGKMNLGRIDRLSRVLSDIHNQGCEVILVTSAAIAAGVSKMGLKERPTQLRMKQAAAAVGQCALIHLYDKFFSEYGQTVAQILLASHDVSQTEQRENLRGTFSALLESGVIPVVNENDSVSPEEIESGGSKLFGDNDTLSAIVATLCRADLLVLLSDIDGLYDDDPRANPKARLIREVTELTDEIRLGAGGAGTSRGTGGMVSKLGAAEIAMGAGIDMVIANGKEPELLHNIYAGEPVGTYFRGGAASKCRGENDWRFFE